MMAAGSVFAVLGDLGASHVVLVVGRNNIKKPSFLLEALLGDLHEGGYAVGCFQSSNTQTARWLDQVFSSILSGGLCAWCQRHEPMGRHVRRLVKACVLLGCPVRWGYTISLFVNPNIIAARELRQQLSRLPSVRVHLFAHSAGGIVSTLVADEPAVASVVCFGYPFKHPQKPEEPARTAHLAEVSKPLMIIQGDEDQYGTAPDALRYGLSDSTVLVPVASDHDYDQLGADEYRRCSALLLAFLSSMQNP
jgi:hypothetical protein